jgi:hypothetical protein
MRTEKGVTGERSIVVIYSHGRVLPGDMSIQAMKPSITLVLLLAPLARYANVSIFILRIYSHFSSQRDQFD